MPHILDEEELEEVPGDAEPVAELKQSQTERDTDAMQGEDADCEAGPGTERTIPTRARAV